MVLHGNASDYPDNLNVTYEYPDGRLLIYENYPFTPTACTASTTATSSTARKATWSSRAAAPSACSSVPRATPGPTEGKELRGQTGYEEHMADFLDAVRTRRPTRASAEIAHRSCALVHLGEIAFATRGRLDFDPRTERFVDCDEANSLLTKEYRQPYGLGAA